MSILVIKATNNILKISIYKIYQNKKMVAELYGTVTFNGERQAHLLLYRSNNATIADKFLDFKPNQSIADKLKLILQHKNLVKYEFNYIVNTIDYVGENYTDITLFHPKVVTTISNDLPNNKLQLAIVDYLNKFYTKAKHYLCFNAGFYATTNYDLYSSIKLNINNQYGLHMASISNKLLQYSTQKYARKTWLIIYLESSYTVFSIIKKFDCVASYVSHSNIFEKDKTINKDNCLKIAQGVSVILTVIGEVHGIIISGGLGLENAKVRKSILKPLDWSGITINAKANKYIISKKTSTLPILLIKSNEDDAILNQLIKRL